MSPSPPQIRIAILGGGLAGASLIFALQSHPHLDVHIFESAPAFREAGAAIGLARNATQALDLIGPGAAECLRRAGGVSQYGVRFMLAQGASAGAMVDTTEAHGKPLISVVHRTDLVREFLSEIPESRMHTNKKVETIERPSGGEGPVTLTFVDGTTHECDLLVGADGIHSRVRKEVLGESDPAATPVFAGWWMIMTLTSLDEAEARFGKDLIDVREPREYHWIGEDTFLLHNILSDSRLVQIAVGVKCDDNETTDEWRKEVVPGEVEKAYQGWPSNLKTAIGELVCKDTPQQALYFWHHLPAKTYVKGPICLMGDAAHTTTPWLGSGGGMTIEDSMILSKLLGQTKSLADALVALKVYDEVRRPRTQRIVELSKGTGLAVTGRHPDMGLDLAKLKAGLMCRWDFSVYFDNAKHVDESLQLLHEKLHGSNGVA